MSVGYLYDSAKDNLRWNKLSIKEHIGLIMQVGNLVHLSDEDFNKTMNDNEILTVSRDDVLFMYENYYKERSSRGSN